MERAANTFVDHCREHVLRGLVLDPLPLSPAAAAALPGRGLLYAPNRRIIATNFSPDTAFVPRPVTSAQPQWRARGAFGSAALWRTCI